MVFVGGARQVGKTTLGKSLLTDPAGYLNWDIAAHREQILKRERPTASMLFFDEIHKYRGWRNYLKGLFDEFGKDLPILVSGSARLDLYRYAGDSLQGRYHSYRLHPLSVAELKINQPKDFLQLLRLGGFPEPFFSGSEEEAKRWSREYRQRLVRDEINGMEQIHDLAHLELLAIRLPELVGAPLSINALREDLQTSHKTVSRWIDILERFYAIFRISPFGSPKIRAVKKEQKHYHLDWSLIASDGYRFENLVAVHLLKWIDFEADTKGRDLELRYFRDTDSREVDFVVMENRKPIRFIEAKWSDDAVNPALRYLVQRFPGVEAWQISATGTRDYWTPERIRVAPALQLLKQLV